MGSRLYYDFSSSLILDKCLIDYSCFCLEDIRYEIGGISEVATSIEPPIITEEWYGVGFGFNNRGNHDIWDVSVTGCYSMELDNRKMSLAGASGKTLELYHW